MGRGLVSSICVPLLAFKGEAYQIFAFGRVLPVIDGQAAPDLVRIEKPTSTYFSRRGVCLETGEDLLMMIGHPASRLWICRI